MEDADDGEQLKRNDLRPRIPILRSGERCTGIARREKQSTTETGIGRCPIVRSAKVVGTSHVDAAGRDNDRGCAFQTAARPEEGQEIAHNTVTVWKKVVLDQLDTAQHGKSYGAAWRLGKQTSGSLKNGKQMYCCAGRRMTQQEREECCAQRREPRAQGGTRPMTAVANRDSEKGGKTARHTEARSSLNPAAQRGGAAKARRRTGLGAVRTRHSVESSMGAARTCTVVGAHGPRSQQAGKTERGYLCTRIWDGTTRGNEQNKTGDDEGHHVARSNERAVNVNVKNAFESLIRNVYVTPTNKLIATMGRNPNPRNEAGKRTRDADAGVVQQMARARPPAVNENGPCVNGTKMKPNEIIHRDTIRRNGIKPTKQRGRARDGRRYRHRVPVLVPPVRAQDAAPARVVQMPVDRERAFWVGTRPSTETVR